MEDKKYAARAGAAAPLSEVAAIARTERPLPEPEALHPRAVLLASEEREITPRPSTLAARLATPSGAPVYVFAIARVHGTNLGFPNPGLLPTKAEWEAQRDERRAGGRGAAPARACAREGRVLGTRSAAKKIVQEAERLGCDAIVMGADPPRSAWVADFIWSQEPQRVRRRAQVPVYLVTDRLSRMTTPPVLAGVPRPPSAVRPALRRASWRRRRSRRPSAATPRARRRSSRTPRRPSTCTSCGTGSVELLHGDQVVDVLEPGEAFGLASVLTGLAPTFTVRAREPTALRADPAASGAARARAVPTGRRTSPTACASGSSAPATRCTRCPR